MRVTTRSLVRGTARALSAALLAFALLGAPVQARAGVPSASPVASLTGRGIIDKAACLGCAIGVIGAGGLTFGGLLATALFYPEAVAACGYLCIRAITT